ncbi:hypothetical protein [Cohaesibacter gelatinilyticus]|uniref:Transmembrane protein (PGPGW) n=1 Tax=Cohaesibacter gelatinilyticus TaxID=372072 RepID=A0A285NE83_9HYPH|nr:hypothetical protein [Cohaesibacter gelatinilyticus]SNZ06236.1 hypothetical protein SAMN06265368_0352 [Cohaesibacter gelatinilyticus]
MVTRLKQGIIVGVAIILFVIGLASVWTPVPAGAILMAFATFLLIANSRSGRNLVRRVRKRFSLIDRQMIWLEDRSENKVTRVLRTTRPLLSRLSGDVDNQL